jgi:hypothetical protein
MPIYGVVTFMGKDTIKVYTIAMLKVLQKEEHACNLCLQIIYIYLVVAESLHLYVGCQFFSYLAAVSYLCLDYHFLILIKHTAGKKESYLSLLITNVHCPIKVHLTLFFIRLANMDTAIYTPSLEKFGTFSIVAWLRYVIDNNMLLLYFLQLTGKGWQQLLEVGYPKFVKTTSKVSD